MVMDRRRGGGSAPLPHGPPALDFERRDCPVCGSAAASEVIGSNLDLTRLGPLAFASRKSPELMHHRLVACPSCDTLYASPAPTAAALEEAYAGAEYDSAESAEYAARSYATFLPRLLRNTPPHGGALDIGAGDGAFLRVLLAAGFDDATGVEPSPAAAAAAAADVRERIRQGVFRARDFEAESFRVVSALQTLEHVPDPLGVCRGARDLLCEGGALMAICHNRRARVNRLLGRRSPIFDVQHLQLFSPQSLRALFRHAGFTDVVVRPVPNRYPLRSWVRLTPVPGALKRRLLRALRGRVGAIPLRLPAGNLAVIGYRRRG